MPDEPRIVHVAAMLPAIFHQVFTDVSGDFGLDFSSVYTLNNDTHLPHLTLASVACEDEQAVANAIAAAKRLCAKIPTQTLRFTGVGAGFRWVWVTTNLTSDLLRLHDELMWELAAFGRPQGTEPFLPHISIGRVPETALEGRTVYDAMDWLEHGVLAHNNSVIRTGDPFTIMSIGIGISGSHGTLPAQGLEVVNLRRAA